MKRDCSHGPRERAVKAAFKRLIEAAGGVELAAAICGVSAASLSNYGNVNVDTFPPVHIVLRLEEAAGCSPVSTLMVDLGAAGGGDAGAAGAAEWFTSVAGLAGSFGEASKLVCDALKDGRIDASERLEISKVTAALLDAAKLMHMMAVEAV